MKEFDVEGIGKVIGLSSALALLVASSYVFGYSIALGIDLFKYFDINDYFRVTIDWLPIVSVCVGAFLWRSDHNDSFQNKPIKVLAKILWGLPLLIFCFGFSIGATRSYLSYRSDVCTNSLVKTGARSIEGVVLFFLDRVVILRDKQGDVLIIPRDDLSISRRSECIGWL